jgi:N-acetylmuramoyl-L-alanine amidase
MKKKSFLLFLLSLLMVVSLSAQQKAEQKAEVSLRFSKQENSMRIVLETNESFMDKLQISTQQSQIKVIFPEPYTLKTQEGLPFEITSTAKSLIIKLDKESETKFFKLSSPARIIFDIRKKEMSETKPLPILSNTFVIDAGHGGYDFGIISKDTSEKDISLNITRILGRILSKQGKKVFFTRKADQYVSIADRINLVNQKNPNIFLSLHSSVSESFNLYNPKYEEQVTNDIAEFYSIFSRQRKYIEKSKVLSDCIEKAIEEEFKVDVKRREMALPLLNSVSAPAVLIELPSPKILIYDQQLQERIATAIINGIALYEQ